MDIPEKDILTYIRLRKTLERTSNYRVYTNIQNQINKLLEPFGGKSIEKEFFKIYCQEVEQRPRYQ